MFHARDVGQDRLGIGYSDIEPMRASRATHAGRVELATMVEAYLEFESPSNCWNAQLAY
jgi:hypothetical protein